MEDHAASHLTGRKILIVEDEYFLADDLARMLQAEGADVIGPAATVEAAERLLDAQRPDCAILDMNLRGAPSRRLAERLEGDGVRYLVLTGYDTSALPDEVRHAPYLEKPATTAAVAGALSELLAPTA